MKNKLMLLVATIFAVSQIEAREYPANTTGYAAVPAEGYPEGYTPGEYPRDGKYPANTTGYAAVPAGAYPANTTGYAAVPAGYPQGNKPGEYPRGN